MASRRNAKTTWNLNRLLLLLTIIIIIIIMIREILRTKRDRKKLSINYTNERDELSRGKIYRTIIIMKT